MIKTEVNYNNDLVLSKDGEIHNNFHIEKMVVYSGDDDYKKNHSMQITAESSGALIVKMMDDPGISGSRLRGEVAVDIYLDSESGGNFVLTISHHKGSVLVETKSLD